MPNIFVIHKNTLNLTRFLLEIQDYKFKRDLPDVVPFKIHFLYYQNGKQWEKSDYFSITKTMQRCEFNIKRKYKTIDEFVKDNFVDLL